MSSREAFAKQSNMIGPAKMCKRFITMMQCLTLHQDAPVTFSTNTASPIVQEKKLLYELFAMADTTTFVHDHEFTKKFVSDFGAKLKINLKDEKVEANIQGLKDTEAFEFVSTIGQLLDLTPEDNRKVAPLV